LKNVITITGLNAFGKSCYYQNYSNTFVSLGVINKNSVDGQVRGKCCSYKAPFSGKYYEGSSLATPIACGLLLRYMVNNNVKTKLLILQMENVGEGPIWSIIHRATSVPTRDCKCSI
jgi:hypothetical protein